MPIPVQQGRTLAALVERFGIKGRHLLQLDEIIVPVAIVEDVRASEIKGTGFADTHFEAGLVGENAVARFTGTPNFNALPLLVTVRTTASARFAIRLNTSAVSSVLTGPVVRRGFNRWNPQQPGAPTAVTFGTFAGAVTGDPVRRFSTEVAEQTFSVDLTGWRIPNAVELNIECETANLGVNWSVRWDTEAVER